MKEPVRGTTAERILRYVRTVGKEGTTITAIKKDLGIPEQSVRNIAQSLAASGLLHTDSYVWRCSYCNALCKARSHCRTVFFPEQNGRHWERHIGGV